MKQVPQIFRELRTGDPAFDSLLDHIELVEHQEQAHTSYCFERGFQDHPKRFKRMANRKYGPKLLNKKTGLGHAFRVRYVLIDIRQAERWNSLYRSGGQFFRDPVEDFVRGHALLPTDAVEALKT